MNLVDLVILQQGNEFAAQGQTASLQELSSPTLGDRARLVWSQSLSDPWLSQLLIGHLSHFGGPTSALIRSAEVEHMWDKSLRRGLSHLRGWTAWTCLAWQSSGRDSTNMLFKPAKW